MSEGRYPTDEDLKLDFIASKTVCASCGLPEIMVAQSPHHGGKGSHPFTPAPSAPAPAAGGEGRVTLHRYPFLCPEWVVCDCERGTRNSYEHAEYVPARLLEEAAQEFALERNAAVQKERERCARIAEEFAASTAKAYQVFNSECNGECGLTLAAKIREGK